MITLTPFSLLFSLYPLTVLSLAVEAAGNPTNSGNDIARWCDKTPYPEPCKCYFTNDNTSVPKHLSEFRQMLVKSAMDRAVTVRSDIARFGMNCTGDSRRRAVWSDCLELYDDTVLQLNRTRTGVSGGSCTDFDASTWLSTALTNIETCRSGSSDLKISDFITPIMCKTNLSQLISNTLAINAALIHADVTTCNSSKNAGAGEHFPIWVSGKDRRLLQSSIRGANLVVAKDGSGHFRTVQAAIEAAGRRKVTSARFVIYVKRGVYKENILVRNNNDNVMLVGDGMKYTIITASRSVKGGYTTYNSATAGIEGLHFIAKGITFRNTAGPEKGQAVALRSASDLAIFYKCSVEGYQDTLMVHSQRQFFRDCSISGTVDFIFGNAAAVFQNCLILPRRPLHGQANVITAQGRADPFQTTGFSFHNSKIFPSPDLVPVLRTVKTYLGRPWMKYSRTVVMKTYIDGVVSPLGWSPWIKGSVFGLDTLFYAEYKNTGPSSSTRFRVRWKGFHVLGRDSEAAAFTVERFIAGGAWLPRSGVPFTSGL
ncbi:PREDICTED: probable pectinesterase/pectinesterase inhibitor 59 [Tarenaya hassleriana]|uniref:probable pectinesterase/pectinesterase inhibitor 59 n=1 Tax=Tarenaya hassleriana TaxID=28532 RepID=UPI00053C404B|nr:PREDICTED: probable pectinesterase/pectinesterase inhibitor 59 [Tarenaya hassleriana]